LKEISGMTLANLVTPERVIPHLRAALKAQVLQALAHVAAAETGHDEKRIMDAVRARGDLTSFGIGRGIALPHGTVSGLGQPLAVFARLGAPVDFGAADGRPADLAMLILTPEGEDATLLRALALAARRLRDREVAEKLRGATGAEALHVVLTSDVWRRSPHDLRAERHI
jgi:nitrogen PTS system EIIA component